MKPMKPLYHLVLWCALALSGTAAFADGVSAPDAASGHASVLLAAADTPPEGAMMMAAPPAAEAPSDAAEPAAAPAPVPNKGDVAWMMLSTLLVILMTVPGLAP